ncbi:hypothetical protein [Alkalilacustris brevis]|uniref:hypothetical protein n=1 Tax=Alkalilacustris brevis TaxID=2026338 RepID=UPI000E0E019B|nr:hypothetical protein [Alkalilacustris brevis]
MPNWSDELIALTRRHVDAMLATPPRERLPICMKHWEDRYGLLLLKQAEESGLMIRDVTTGESETFQSFDDLVADGWAID